MGEQSPNRRMFLQGAMAGAGAIALASVPLRRALAADEPASPGPGGIPASAPSTRPLGIRKAVIYSMIRPGSTPVEKFAAARAAGFDGVEMESPSALDRDAVLRARDVSGLTIHGVIDSSHWKDRLSDPDPAVRQRGLDALRTALRDAHAWGAATILLVPGAVHDKNNENFEQVWQRSQAEIRKVLPLAGELGVKIAIEDVWNGFITTPEQMCKYIDELNSPMVGSYFDIGNVVKWGIPPATWVRTLNRRILKLHVKGYSHAKQWVKIGEGDEDWPDVRKALAEIGYHGWATAEVPGGDAPELADIHRRMLEVLGA